MNGKRRSFSPPAVGGSALLVIFAVLCLTVFAMLSLATVQADRRTSDASAQAVSDYYAADAQASTILARLRKALAEQTGLPDGVSAAGEVYSYSVPISDTQELQVEVRADGADYTVLRWQAVSTADWQTDDTLDIWDGGVVG